MTAFDGPRRRPPRAARARVAATAVSVAAMLSLGGVLAWRDGNSAATTSTSVETQSNSGTGSSSSAASGSATSGATSGASSSDSSTSSGTSSVEPHTTSGGS